MDNATLILACGDPFKNVGPVGWLVIYAFLAGIVVSCVLAIVNPILAATMKAPPARKRLHLRLAAAYIVPGLVFALALMSGSDVGAEFLMWIWLIYFFALPLWTIIHFVVLISVRQKLRREASNAPAPTA